MKSFVLGLLVLYFTGSLALFALPPLKKRQSPCDDTELMPCTKEFAEVLNLFRSSSNDDAYQQTCSLQDTLKDCINTKVIDCSEDVKMTFVAMEDVFSYICSTEGRDTMLTESNCIANHDFEQSIQLCSGTVQPQMQENTPVNDTICGWLDNMVGCVQEKVKQKCSVKAGNFVGNVFSRMWSPYTNKMECNTQDRQVRDLFKFISYQM